jgi:Tol biopolymer transport system component
LEEKKILQSWKEIASYLGRAERTCRRWEKEFGLPVHRMDGSPRASVFAYKGELDRWLERLLHEKEVTSREITVKFSLRKIFVPALALVVIAAVAILLVFVRNRQPSKRPAPPSHKQLTFIGDATVSAISPDGKFIAYVTGEFRKGQKVWVQDMASGRSIEVFNGDSCRYLRWTPDSSEITVCAEKESRVGTFLVSRLGGPPHQIKTFRYVAWSPDGSQFAGLWQAHIDGRSQIYIVNKLTGKWNSFYVISDPILFAEDIDWSPSGDRLLALTINKENKYAIWTIKTDGSQQNMVLEENVVISSPRWAPKADAVFYLRGQSVSQPKELWKLPISRDTGKQAKNAMPILTGIPMGKFFGLSADGKKCYYTRESQFSNLWLARIEGSEKSRTVKTRQLMSGTRLHAAPSISPDGKFVAFSRGSAESMNIYVMPIEGGNPTQLTFFNSFNTNPVWSPDGTEIAFGSNEGGKTTVWKVDSQEGRIYQFAKTELSESSYEIVWAPMPNIIYHKMGHRNYQILNPETEEESPLVKDESVGWIFSPVFYSPDRKKIAVPCNRPLTTRKRAGPDLGIYIISLEDRSDKLIKSGDYQLFGWTADGKWLYAYGSKKSGELGFLMIEVESGQTKPLPMLPFTIEGNAYYKLIDDKPEIFVVQRTQSDVWVIDNFDRIIK